MTGIKKTAIFLAAALMLAACAPKVQKVDLVDPTIGGVGLILQPTRPTVHLPNSMMRSYPWKNDQLDDRIHYFPLSMPSHRVAWIFRMLPVSNLEDPWKSCFVVDSETCTPYLYSALEELTGNSVEYTAEAHSAAFRMKFTSETGHFRLGLQSPRGIVNVSGSELSGEDNFNGVRAFFYGRLSSPAISVSFREDSHKTALIETEPEVEFRYGISYISVEQAKANLEAEQPQGRSFDDMVLSAKDIWEDYLGAIDVEGGSPEQQKVFYTALYRCAERMVNISEQGKYYSAFDRQVHEDDQFYVDNWLWDMYLAHQPLMMIIRPELVEESLQSYADMYSQCGWMPNFAVAFGDWPAMTGNNAAIWAQDAWAKGLHGFDFETMYEGARKGSLDATMIPWRNGPATDLDRFLGEHGYMPGLHPGEKETEPLVDPNWERRQCVSVTIDNAYCDWCLAQMADCLGKTDDKELFLARSEFYKNVFRVEKGFVWAKDKDGNWIEEYSPSLGGRDYFTEINGYNFNWCAKHDLSGLFELMGGPEAAEAKLDDLFRAQPELSKWKFWGIQPDASGLVGQFVMGNEPSFHIPYIYNYLGAPWKAQKRVRQLLDTWFNDTLFGIPGDEDGGGMSAFVVLSMAGFYQVVPGIPVYCIGSPVFDKIAIRLPEGRKFTIVARNNSEENRYVQSAKLNGKVLDRSWFTHEELANGGTLELVMGREPNTEWGRDNLPPSSVDYRVYEK